ncbi:MAG: ABC transporter ATP-binding protein [Blastocatellia bacterium]|nr:ABC transporter ATP-binding protein [Blastocatellia bacterium]MBK6425413.1 ABC transporter ATP-binding protein [Blastocatellia bacterium]
MSDETTKNPNEEEALGKAYDGRLARRLAGYLRPYRARVAVGVVLLMFGSLVELAGPLLTALAVDRYIPNRDYAGLNLIALGYVGCLLMAFGLSAANTYLMQMLGQYVQYDLRRQIFAKLQRIDVSYYDRNPVGRLITRLTSDVDALNELFTSGFVAIFGDVITLTAITIVLFVFDWRLACVTLVILPAMLLVTGWFRRGAREGFRKVRLRIARINAFLQEHVSGMSVVQLFGREKLELGRFDKINDEHRVANIETIFYYAVFFPAIEIISSAGIALILWYGGGRVIAGAMSLGALIAFIQYAQRFYQPIRDLSDKYNILQAAMAASERIFNLLDEQPKITSPASPAAVAPRALGRIEFRNVWFAYKDEDWVLRDVSFTVEPGQSVGVVGHTGAGKTTLTNLMLRFYDIQKGAILLDGIDVREYDLNALRRNFSIVLQDVYLFSGSVRHNITLGNLEIADDRVVLAATEVHADSFIRQLPEQYETAIHERGAGLSVGQKQLISFARALAYDPPILILDEATSSIDSETELLIRDAVVRLMDKRTSVIVAHRLSTIQRVDKIMVMHKGELREEGSHQELLAKRGLYYRLYELQYKDQEVGEKTPAIGD